MDLLGANGYHPVDFNDLRAYFGGVAPLPSKPVVITLDDGYADLYAAAYPILHSHKFKAVAYIVTSFVGQSRYVTAAQVLEMDHNGIEIASHTVDHANLSKASLYWAQAQLTSSKLWLENLTGHSIVDFAYPSGKYSATAIAALGHGAVRVRPQPRRPLLVDSGSGWRGRVLIGLRRQPGSDRTMGRRHRHDHHAGAPIALHR